MENIRSLQVSAYTIPTATPESDGTYAWESTTLVLVELAAGDQQGIGYSYADAATARLIHATLREAVVGQDALSVIGPWQAMVQGIRNLGRPGIASLAISAVDVACWDLKAKLLNLPLATLLGQVRPAAEIYGSGGFTSYSQQQLRDQLGGWAAEGLRHVKMKIGREPRTDIARVRQAREAIGDDVELFVDANGAYSRKQALAVGEQFAEFAVKWFEEPVTSDDLAGLRLLRDRLPAGMDVAAGEYGFDAPYFRRMLAAEAVDCLQADATRCGGITGFLNVAALCHAHQLPLSAHCAPALHVAAGCATPAFRHLEYFFDHARIERLLMDGAVQPRDGQLSPDLTRPGLGLEFKRADAKEYEITNW
jgi:L-alanine-DL-glutamate epimerase-like enolase superfamily enzyme